MPTKTKAKRTRRAVPDLIRDRTSWMDSRAGQAAPIAGTGAEDMASIVPAMYQAWGAYGYQPAITWYQLANMYVSWEYTATEKIARTLASLPAKLFRYENTAGKTLKPYHVKSLMFADRWKSVHPDYIIRKLKKDHGIKRVEIDDHPFLDLVNRPNEDMVRFNFWRLLAIHLELNGAVGIYKAKIDGFGNPTQLYILPTTWTGQFKPVPATDGVNLIKSYRLLDQNINTEFTREEIIWIHYTSLRNPFEGMSALKAQLYAFNMDTYLMQQINAFYKNGAMFSNVFKTEERLTQKQYNEMAAQLSPYQGARNAGQKFILHSGLSMEKPMNATARESMIDEIEKMARDKQLSAHDVSAGKIGLVESQNRSNLETVDMGFFNEAIKPRAMLITEYFDQYLVRNYDENLDFEFDYPHFQDRQMDITERQSNISNGITTRNEERDKMGLEPIDGGDVVLVSPMNTPLSAIVNPPEPPPASEPPPFPPEDEETPNGEEKEFNPSQERDESGRWTAGGGGSGTAPSSAERQIWSEADRWRKYVDAKGYPINPIDPKLTMEEKVEQLRALGKENKALVDPIMKEFDAQFGTTSDSRVKSEEIIAEKATRPSKLEKDPEWSAEKLGDTFGFRVGINHPDEIEAGMAHFMKAVPEARILEASFDQIDPVAGWRMTSFNMRMPNGQIAEFNFTFKEMIHEQNHGGGHKIYEKWRVVSREDLNARRDEWNDDMRKSRELYGNAWSRGLQRAGINQTAFDNSVNKARASISSTYRKSSKNSATPTAPGVHLPELSRNQVRSPLIGSSDNTSARLSSLPRSASSFISASNINIPDKNEKVNKTFWDAERKAIAWKKYDREAQAYEPLFKRVMKKFFRDVNAQVQDRLEKHGVKIKANIGAMSFNSKQKWIAEHKDRLDEFTPAKDALKKRLKTDIKPVYVSVLEASGKTRVAEFSKLMPKKTKDIEADVELEYDVYDPEVVKWLGNRLEEFSETTAKTTIADTKRVLRADFENGEPLVVMGEHLREYYTDAETYRGNLIARTESTAAMNEGDMSAVEQMGLGDAVGKIWLAEPDSATRETHAEAGGRYSDGYDAETGEPMTLDKEFEVGDDKMLHPAGGQIAEENCNCRCGMVYEVLDKSEQKGGWNSGRYPRGTGKRPYQHTSPGMAEALSDVSEPETFTGELNPEDVAKDQAEVMRLTNNNTLEGKIEYVGLTLADGSHVAIKGGKQECIIPERYLTQMNYVAHNHPSDASFSAQDVALLTSFPNLNRIDAVAGRGETVYSLEKPAGWENPRLPPVEFGTNPNENEPIQNWGYVSKVLKNNYSVAKANVDLKEGYSDRYLKNPTPKTADDLWREHSHGVMKIMADMYGLKYTKTVGGKEVKKADGDGDKIPLVKPEQGENALVIDEMDSWPDYMKEANNGK